MVPEEEPMIYEVRNFSDELCVDRQVPRRHRPRVLRSRLRSFLRLAAITRRTTVIR
jgi:hypothetical protein